MQGIRLNEYALKIQLAKELPQHRPFVVLPGGVAGLTDGHTQGGGVQRDLSNECRAAAGSIELRMVLPLHTSWSRSLAPPGI